MFAALSLSTVSTTLDRLRRAKQPPDEEVVFESLQAAASDPPDHLRLLIEKRIKEVTEEKAKASRSATVMRWSGYLMTFTQVIVGGVLANAYVQRETSPKVVGFIGVLVLIASLLKQTFQFEAKAQAADERRRNLTSLLVAAEDELTLILIEEATDGQQNERLTGVLRDLSFGLTGKAPLIRSLLGFKPLPGPGRIVPPKL